MHEEQSHTNKINCGSRWFKRFYNEVKAISPHIRFKRIKLGFYRIYWRNHYIYEAYKEMPIIGFTWDDIDPRLESKTYCEEYEDQIELTRNIKNFIEGYYDSIKKIQRRVYLHRNGDKEFNQRSQGVYKNTNIK